MIPKNVQMPNPNPKYKPPGTPAGGRGGKAMKMTLNEEIELLRNGKWFDKIGGTLPSDEYLILGWAIGDVLDTLESLRMLQPKAETNADRIRAMSDEELAEELVIEIEGLFPSLVYVPMATGNIYISQDKAEKEMLEYLQQPAEEETP